MKKKKNTNAKAKRKKKQKKAYMLVTLGAIILALCTISSIYHMLGKYDGLGLKHALRPQEYKMTHVVSTEGRLSYEDEQYEAVTGIDVSAYQGDIDWQAVKDDGIDFAMIRVGYRGYSDGRLHLDKRFTEHLKGAKSAGLEVGVYFFSQAVTPEEAIEEARFVVRHIWGKGITYPVGYDMEPVEHGDRITNLSKLEKTETADAFCQVMKRHGYTPAVYGNPQWLRKHVDLEYLTKYEVWLAHYASTTSFQSAFSMWQYTDSGKVSGIDTPVDMNLYFMQKD